MARTYSLRRRWRSHDFDIVNDEDNVRGQVIESPAGFTVYLIGEFQPLLPALPDAEAALDAFESWASKNSTATIPVLPKRDKP
ncbi:hypothetical protein BH11ACT5_BH11ACT5_24000 [soil metagenome]